MKKYLFYVAIMCFGGTGDVMLKRGMMDLGPVTLNNWPHIFSALLNPWILLGICCLIGFFYSYLTALSWADLTYVLPATAFGYVIIALWSQFFLHEKISPWRWTGVLLITCGVGLVTRGPSLTRRGHAHDEKARLDMKRMGEHELA